jgi:hypothetical protein
MSYPPLQMPIGPLVPYISPTILVNAPTGIAWSTIPPGKTVTPAQRLAAQSDICNTATSQADGYCNQVLRATIDNEEYSGPDFRATVQVGSGLGRIVLQRWPVLAVTNVQVSPNAFPRQWTTVPSGYYEPEYPPIGLYGTHTPSGGGAGGGGQAMLLSQGWLNWANGRNGFRIRVSYINGWPHTALTAAASAGDDVINVTDCTGWGPIDGSTQGATGILYDATFQETVQVLSASASMGPGVLALASPLQFSHDPGVIFSTFPGSIIWACTLLGTAMALTRGTTSTTVHAIPGGGGGAGKDSSELVTEAELLLHPYRRVI